MSDLTAKIKLLCRFMFPFSLRRLFYRLRIRKKTAAAVHKFITKQKNNNDECTVADFLLHNTCSQIPYEFTKKYKPDDIIVYADRTAGMKYVLHENKKLYFPRYFGKDEVRDYYNILLMEQDIESPHRYETYDFHVEDGMCIADVGAAEGIWALSNVDKARELYLFECEAYWIESLQKTFEPWQEKIYIK